MQPQKEHKQPPPGEVSLNYMSWSVKDLVKEVQKVNNNLENLVKEINSFQKILLTKDNPPF